MTESQNSQENFIHTQRWEEFSLYLEKIRFFFQEFLVTLNEILKRAGKKLWEETKYLFSKLTPLDYFFGGISFAILFGASIIFLLGFALIGYQVFLWLKNGMWTEFPILVIFDYLFQGTALHDWLQNPGSWFGLHQVIEWMLENIPLSLTLIVDGALGIFAMLGIITAAIFIRRFQFKRLEKK
ncbi:MAG: hypothetical protein ACE5EK_01135 [Nitrospinales bacterium]